MLETQESIVEINLSNLKNNLSFLRSKLNSDTKVMAVVKASAYGSDSVIISNFLEQEKIDYLAVAYCSEGVFLRKSGIKIPILVMHPQIGDFKEIIDFNLEPSIYSFRILNSFFEALKTDSEYPFQIKFNTGLNRLGFSEDEITKLVKSLNGKHPKFIFSHLGASDEKDKDFTNSQIKKFLSISDKFDLLIKKVTKKHLLNTSGILNFPDYQFDMVRSGIGLYGFGNDERFRNSLKPTISLKTVVSQIHEINKGEYVGYNKGYKAMEKSKIATLPIGHADGISRNCGHGKVKVLINDTSVPTIGNICMDMLMVDISNINCKEGDEVIIFDDKNLTAEDLGDLTNTISYEVLTSISNRIKRVIK